MTEPVFSKASGLRWSVFLGKLEAFPINMRTLLMAVAKSVVKLQASAGNVSQRVCDWLYTN